MRSEDRSFPECVFELETCTLSPLQRDQGEYIGLRMADMEPWRTLGYRVETLSRYLTRPDPSLGRYTATVSGKLAGVVCVRDPWLLGPFIELLAVFAEYQGGGVGGCILKWVETRGGWPNVWVTVSSFNVRALSFYERFGFQEVARLKDLIRTGFHEILLRKDLGRANR